MERKEVVTAFLRHTGKILIVRRSGRVGSYQGRWSAISGYLEGPTPLAQAWREIREETGLSEQAVHLVRAGEPLEVPDARLDTCWVVHPFLFEVDDPERVRLDWENLDLRWVDPAEINTLPTVPKLAEALQRCLEGGVMEEKAFREALAAFRSDRTHGASELARRALQILEQSAAGTSADSLAGLAGCLRERTEQLRQARPSMAPVANLLERWAEPLTATVWAGLPQMREELAQRARVLYLESESAAAEAARRAAEFLGPDRTLFTHSSGSTVRELFRRLRDRGVSAIVTESRPLNEGVQLAETLAGWEIPVTLITEAQIGLFIDKADAVVLGADSLLADGSLINKAGSLLVALAARERDVPFYVCCESFKRCPAGVEEPVLEEMSPVELGYSDREGITIRNLYFDLTPAHLISGWIDEIGVRLAEEEGG